MTGKTMSVRKQRVSEVQTAAFALCASAVWFGVNAAGPTLPVQCGAGACGANGPTKWLTGGAATWSATSNSLQINQSTNSAILNWASFNIGAGNSVNFTQPTSSSIAL